MTGGIKKAPYAINTLKDAETWLRGETIQESETSERDLLELGKQGTLNLFVAIGNNELMLYTTDGKEITMHSDGLIPLNSMQCHFLAINKSITLNNFEMIDAFSGKPDKFYFRTPILDIKLDSLRVKGTDLLIYISQMIDDDSKSIKKNVDIEVNNDEEYDNRMAALFDPVTPEELETMFPDENNWKTNYCKRANENGLNHARTGRGKYNPYKASLWWLKNKKPLSWDLSKINRKLASNIPTRNIDYRYLLTGHHEE